MFDFWWLFWVVLGVAAWAWLRWPRADEFLTAAHHWPGTGVFGLDVVGESYHQNNLLRLADAPRTTATLTPYDTNPHDAMAVKVEISGQMVGHLSRDKARSFRKKLANAGLSTKPSTCAALITGGHDLRDGSRAHFGVRLDIDM